MGQLIGVVAVPAGLLLVAFFLYGVAVLLMERENARYWAGHEVEEIEDIL